MTRSRLVHRTSVKLAAVLALVTTAVVAGSTADASTPNEGTVTGTSTEVTWSGGPFAAPNATGDALDQPDCSVPQSCDDFTLHVSTPAGYGTTHTLAIKVAWANTAADFDVYVLDAAGNVVGTSASQRRPRAGRAAAEHRRLHRPGRALRPARPDATPRRRRWRRPRPTRRRAPTPRRVHATTPRRARCPTRTTPVSRRSAPASKTGATISSPTCPPTRSPSTTTTPAKATWTDASAQRRPTAARRAARRASTRSCSPTTQTGRTFESQLSGATR